MRFNWYIKGLYGYINGGYKGKKAQKNLPLPKRREFQELVFPLQGSPQFVIASQFSNWRGNPFSLFLCRGEADSHASDIGHWLGMTEQEGCASTGWADRVVRPYKGFYAVSESGRRAV